MQLQIRQQDILVIMFLHDDSYLFIFSGKFIRIIEITFFKTFIEKILRSIITRLISSAYFLTKHNHDARTTLSVVNHSFRFFQSDRFNIVIY